MVKSWRCPECKTQDEANRYRSGKIARCYDCQSWVNLTSRVNVEIDLTRDEFLAWRRADPAHRLCYYCGIDTQRVYALNITNPRTKRRLEQIGVDRLDNKRGYAIDNIVPCCTVCNLVRGAFFSSEEMRLIGVQVQAVWHARLAALGMQAA